MTINEFVEQSMLEIYIAILATNKKLNNPDERTAYRCSMPEYIEYDLAVTSPYGSRETKIVSGDDGNNAFSRIKISIPVVGGYLKKEEL